MNKKDLKKILKPLIKECIKEVIFEDGILSSVISEVMVAAGGTQVREVSQKQNNQAQANKKLQAQASKKLEEQRKQMLDAIGKDAFNGVNIFEGTTPTSAPSQPNHGPLSGADPRDPGVDISDFANAGVWKKLAGN